MYGIYEAVYYASWKITDLRLDDELFNAARGGDITAQNYVIIRYKDKIRKKYGKEKVQQSLSRIYWDDRNFDIKRVRDAGPLNPQPTKRPTQPSGECRCGEDAGRDMCTQCDIGYHCHNSRNGCNLRP